MKIIYEEKELPSEYNPNIRFGKIKLFFKYLEQFMGTDQVLLAYPRFAIEDCFQVHNNMNKKISDELLEELKIGEVAWQFYEAIRMLKYRPTMRSIMKAKRKYEEGV